MVFVCDGDRAYCERAVARPLRGNNDHNPSTHCLRGVPSNRNVDFSSRHVVGPGGPHARNCGAPRPSHRRPSCRRRPRPGLQPSRRRSGWPRPARGCARGMRGLGASGAHAPPRSTGRRPRVAAPARRAAAAHRRLRARGSHPLWHVLEVAKVQASACASHHAPYFLFTVFDGSCAPTSSTCSPPSWCSTMTTTTRSPSPRLPPSRRRSCGSSRSSCTGSSGPPSTLRRPRAPLRPAAHSNAPARPDGPRSPAGSHGCHGCQFVFVTWV